MRRLQFSRLRRMAARTQATLKLVQHWRDVGSEEMLWLLETIGVGYGHYRSVKEGSSINADGEPLPWYTYPAIDYLTQFDFGAWDAFEFGGGNSSKFWSKRCRSLTTVESDPKWHAKIVAAAGPTQEVMLETDAVRYADAITRHDRSYKLIVIDGQHRRACSERAVHRLEPGGIIVFDNTDWWPQTTSFLRANGLQQIDFTGQGAINQYTWATSIFFRDRLDLKLATDRQPLPATGSIRQLANPE